MRRLFILLVVFVLAVWAGIIIANDPGYSLFVYKNWSVEMPLWLAFCGLVVIFVVFYALIRVFSQVGFFSERLSFWSSKRQNQAANKALCRGFIALAEADWRRAEKQLTGNISTGEMALFNYLMAARAADAQGKFDQRDRYLLCAYQADPQANLAVVLSKVHLQIQHNQFEQALATLQQLLKKHKKHPEVLRYLAQVYQALGDWQSLGGLFSVLKNAAVLSDKQYNELLLKTHIALLSRTEDLDQLNKQWQQFTKVVRKIPDIIECFATLLLDYNQTAQAETVVYDSLHKQLDDCLLKLYGRISGNLQRQFKHVQAWHKQVPHNASVLFALAQLAVRLQLWGQAKEYFEKSLQIKNRADVCYIFSEYLESQNQHDLARQYYRQGLRASLCLNNV